MILPWEDLVSCYGGEIEKERRFFDDVVGDFASAGRSTHAMLCCRYAPSHARVAVSEGEHAEARLLTSTMWTQEIPAALQEMQPAEHGLIVGVMVINRTPCPRCTSALERKLLDLRWRYEVRFPYVEFILASLGAYVGQQKDGGYPDETTMGCLRRLDRAGWRQCVLQVGGALTDRGKWLQQALANLPGNAWGNKPLV